MVWSKIALDGVYGIWGDISMSVPGASQFAKSLAVSAGECPLEADN